MAGLTFSFGKQLFVRLFNLEKRDEERNHTADDDGCPQIQELKHADGTCRLNCCVFNITGSIEKPAADRSPEGTADLDTERGAGEHSYRPEEVRYPGLQVQ